MKEIVQDLTQGITLRRASIEDATTIVAHRRAMFRDQGHRDTAALDSMAEKFQPWLQSKMNSGEYLAWLATTADQRGRCRRWLVAHGLASTHGRLQSPAG